MRDTTEQLHRLPIDPALVVASELARDRRVMLFGMPGVDKSTLAIGLADKQAAVGRTCYSIDADPGSPAYGVSGALTLTARCLGQWETIATAPLCMLNAGRFRLPLISAVRPLLTRCESGVSLLDSPGVVRDMPGIYRAMLYLRPQFGLDGLRVSLRVPVMLSASV